MKGGKIVPEVFITLEEAAELEGVKYDTMQKRIKRNPEGYTTKTRAREGGGKDQVIEGQINSIESFEDVQNDLLDAIGKGFAVSEIIWGYDEGHVVVKEIKSRHQKRFFWDSVDDSFKVRTAEAPQGIELPTNKFILHRYKARSGHPSRAGVLRVVAWMYLFKNYDLKDWVSFAEIYGLPLRLGKYQPGASEEDKRALMAALVQIGADAAGIIPDGTTIEFITTEKNSSTNLYEQLARYCDEQISKAVLGQTLTSDSGGGSYAQSKTHIVFIKQLLGNLYEMPHLAEEEEA